SGVVIYLVEVLSGGYAVVNREEAHDDRDDHGRHRQSVEKRGEDRGRKAEHQRQRNLRSNRDQQLREREEQKVLQKKDARDHEDQQQNHFKVVFGLGENGRRRRKADGDRFDREQAARLQRIAAQRHRQGKDELE